MKKDIKILTEKGYKNIENIQNCDRILTHTNTYKNVCKSIINNVNTLYRLDSMCVDVLYTTEKQSLYVMEKHENLNGDKIFTEPKWVKIKDLNENYYIGTAINQEDKLPDLNGNNKRLKNKFNKEEFWWLVGKYLSSGSFNSRDLVSIICDSEEEFEILSKLEILNFNYEVFYNDDNSTINVILSSKKVNDYFAQFGDNKKNKQLTSDILNLPAEMLKQFIAGYTKTSNEGLNKVYSTSEELIYGIGQCIAKAYNKPYLVIYKNDEYELTWKDVYTKQDKPFYDNGYIWYPIKYVEKIDYDGSKYDLEVECDHSYTINNVIVRDYTDEKTPEQS